jgi:hypothetical protein
MDLYPTPTRVALLREIDDRPGKVYSCLDFDTSERVSYWRKEDGSERAVTAKCSQMERAGWLRLGAAGGPSMYSRRPWELTDKGREILAGAS